MLVPIHILHLLCGGRVFVGGGGLLFRLKVCPILCVAVIIEVHWCLCNEVSCNQSGIHVT